MNILNRRWLRAVVWCVLVVFGFGGGPASALYELHLPDEVCLGETVELSWNPSSVPASYSFGSIFLYPTDMGFYKITDDLCDAATACDEDKVDSFDWSVSWAIQAGVYNITVAYIPPQPLDFFTPTIHFLSDVEVKNCELVDPGAILQAEVEELERQLWQEHVRNNVPPGSPFPQCWSCGFKVDLSDTFLALDRAGIQQEVAMHVLDSRGQVVADYGTFAPGRRGYSGLPPETSFRSSSRLAVGRNCGLRFEIVDTGGLPLASAPICVEIGR